MRQMFGFHLLPVGLCVGKCDKYVCVFVVSNLVKAIHEHNVERGSDSGGVAGGVSWGEFCAVSIDIYSSNHICR